MRLAGSGSCRATSSAVVNGDPRQETTSSISLWFWEQAGDTTGGGSVILPVGPSAC